MKIALTEIWNFINLIVQDKKDWTYALHAGRVSIEDIPHGTLLQLKEDEDYDTELLPSLFTFREILWQPDVFTETTMSLPGLRILKAHCEETAQALQQTNSPVQGIYAQLILGLAKASEEVIVHVEQQQLPVNKALRQLRQVGFPIIKFFTYHPKNRLDYHRDAVNRLNYAVKVMLTQFHGRYTELEDPHWNVYYNKAQPKKKPAKENLKI